MRLRTLADELEYDSYMRRMDHDADTEALPQVDAGTVGTGPHGWVRWSSFARTMIQPVTVLLALVSPEISSGH